MHLEDLDIPAMRAEILQRQHEMCKPFQEELRKLEILEQLVVRAQKTNGTPAKGRPSGKGKRQGLRHVKPNGHARQNDYVGMGQRDAVKMILAESAGLNCVQLVERLQQGGYRFTSVAPSQSLGTALRYMVKKGQLKAVEPPEGHRNDGITYYLAEGK